MDMMEEKDPRDYWEKAVKFYESTLSSEEDRNRLERHFGLITSKKVDFENWVLHIGVATSAQVEEYTRLYAKKLEMALAFAEAGNWKVDFVVDEEAAAKLAQVPFVTHEQSAAAGTADMRKEREVKKVFFESTLPLNAEFTFGKFVVGPSNSFAHAAAKAVAEGDGSNSMYNPLFIHGGTGLGKSHIMEAIGNHLLMKCAINKVRKSICYITSEMFLNEYVTALSSGKMDEFHQRYRSFDLMLIDDVQFIAGKEQFQEEFFNTFNALMTLKKQVVMTSDVAPRDLKGLESRLTGRFAQGMVVEIESPSLETRMAILKTKAKEANVFLADDVLLFIAENIHSHVRALEGALRMVVMFVKQNPHIPLQHDVLLHLLHNQIESDRNQENLRPEMVIKEVAAHYKIAVDDLLGDRRIQSFVTPRQLAMFICYKLCTQSKSDIGRVFGKSHGTIYHGVNSIQQQLDVDSTLKLNAEQIVLALNRKPSELFNN